MMVRAYFKQLKKFSAARIVCMLLLVLSISFLAACSGDGKEGDNKNDPGRASAAEQSMKGCWMCPLFEATQNASVGAATGAIPGVARSLISVIAVGYGLWLAVFIMKYAASMKEPDVAEFWKAMAVQAFWVAMGAALLTDLANDSGQSALSGFAVPVYNGFVEAGSMIAGGGGGGLSGLVSQIQEKLNFGTAIAAQALFSPSVLIPMAPMIGLICLVTSVILMLWIPTLLIVCTFRYGIALFMLPLGVAAYVFKPTRSYTGKVAKLFVEVGFTLMGMCTYACCCTEIIQIYVDTYAPYVKNPAIFFTDPAKGFSALVGPGVTGLLFLAFFLVMYAEVAMDLFAGFAGGAGGMSGMGKSMYGAAKGGAKLAKTAVAFGIKRQQRKKDKQAAKDLKKYEKFKDRKGTAGYRHYQEAQKKAMLRGLVDKNGNTTQKFANVARGDKQLLAMRRADLTRQNAALKKANAGLKGKNAALDRLYDKKNANMKGPFKGIRRGLNNLSKNAQKLGNNISRVGNNMQRLGNKVNKVGNSIRNTKLGRLAGNVSNVMDDLKSAKQSSIRGSLRENKPAADDPVAQKAAADLQELSAKKAGVGMARKLEQSRLAQGLNDMMEKSAQKQQAAKVNKING